jgi:hypothetical protein
MTITYDDHNGFVVINQAGTQIACFDTYKEAADFIANGGR